MRIKASALVLYYPAVLIIAAISTLVAVLIPSYYALLPEFILFILFIYILSRLRKGLGIGYSYITVITLIVLISYASIFLIKPELILNEALTEMRQSIIRGLPLHYHLPIHIIITGQRHRPSWYIAHLHVRDGYRRARA